MGTERRRHPRVPSRQRCWCEGDDITIYSQINDFSEGGLSLRTAAHLVPGAPVRVWLPAGAAALPSGLVSPRCASGTLPLPVALTWSPEKRAHVATVAVQSGAYRVRLAARAFTDGAGNQNAAPVDVGFTR